MNIMSGLAVRHLTKNKKRTMITLMGIILSVSMLTAVTGFVVSTREMMRQTFIQARGDWHISFFPVTTVQADEIVGDNRVETGYTEADGEMLHIYLRLKNADRKYAETAEKIAGDYGIAAEGFGFNQELLAVEGIIAGDNSLRTLYLLGGILIFVILTGSVIVIANAFYISASERVRQFGLLKSVGATKQQILRTVLTEGLALSLAGIPVGIAVGFLVETVALTIANKLLVGVSDINGTELTFRISVSGWVILIAAMISLLTIFLSAWFPARRAAKISAIDAIRLAKEIKLRPGSVRTSGLTRKLFGFEGSLAAKALKRSRGKYRATVVSLVVSITLFILSSGFGQMIFKSAELIYPDYGIDVLMRVVCGNDESGLIAELTAGFAAFPEAEIGGGKTMSGRMLSGESFFTEDAKKYLRDKATANTSDGTPVQLTAVDAETFGALCRKAGISPDSLNGDTNPKGILINTAIRDHDGKRIEFRPYNYTNGMTVSVNLQGSDTYSEITLAASVAEMPVVVLAASVSDGCSIVLPESAFDGLSAGTDITAVWTARTQNPAEFAQDCEDIIKAYAPEADYTVIDIAEMAATNSRIYLLMMIFVYGFVGMLSLIAVTGTIGTISTNINLRAQEFAMLSAVGMTPGGLRRMLNLESLFYGMKALFIGLPLANVLCYLLYKSFGLTVTFAYIWPWQGILISIVAVMLITFGTMRYSMKKLAGKNIVETLKDLNI